MEFMLFYKQIDFMSEDLVVDIEIDSVNILPALGRGIF